MAPSPSSPLVTPCRVIAILIIGLTVLLFTFQNQVLSSIHALQPPCSCNSNPGTEASVQSTPRPPALHKIGRTFREMKVLENLTHGADEAWSSILSTPKGGFLWVKYEDTNEAWGVSMFHAIHCLTMLRNTFQHINETTHDGTIHSHEMHGRDSSSAKHEHDPFDAVHIGHCFSYIAQYVMCSADSTIEPPWLTFNDAGEIVDFGIDGEGYTHECRDPSLLFETVMSSEKDSVEKWGWKTGDTVESVFMK